MKQLNEIVKSSEFKETKIVKSSESKGTKIVNIQIIINTLKNQASSTKHMLKQVRSAPERLQKHSQAQQREQDEAFRGYTCE
jgi:proteasome assembly chaperone (PAC2) family protein